MGTRRQFVLGGCAVTASAVAGCLGAGDDSDSEPDPLSREYTDWIATAMKAEQPVQIRAATATEEFAVDAHHLSLNPVDLPAEQIDYRIEFRDRSEETLTLSLGDFSAADATEAARDGLNLELEHDGGSRGFELYTIDVSGGIVGVRQGAQLVTTNRSWFEYAVDASRGGADRLVDTGEEFRLVTEPLDGADQQLINSEIAELDASFVGVGYEYGQEETTATTVLVYGTGDKAERMESDIRDQFELSPDDSLTVDGRRIILSETRPVEEFLDSDSSNI